MDAENAELKDQIYELQKIVAEQKARISENALELADRTEELLAQKEELTAAIEELTFQNKHLYSTLEQLKVRTFEMDQILYRASHDLRAPISSISGLVNIIRMESLNPVILNCCGHMQSQMDQMGNLLTALSSFARIVLEEPAWSTVDITLLFPLIVEDCSSIPSAKNVAVQYRIGERLLRSDPHFLRVMLHALIANAFIFRNTAHAGLIEIRTEIRDHQFYIHIVNDGDGIPKGVVTEIFKMFYRGSEKSVGNGLGLYTAMKCAERLGGTIRVYAEQKTHFEIILPVI